MTSLAATLNCGEVGIWTYQLDLQPASVARAIVAELEDLGFTMLWVSDSSRREVLTNAAFLLAATRRLSVATGIASIYGRAPTTMAFAQRTLAEAFPYRFLLGLGVSHKSIVEGQRGLRYRPPLATMRHYLEAMSSAEYLSPAPPEDGCPIVLGALGPRMLALASEVTAGAHPYHTTPEHTRQAREILGPRAFLAPEQPVVLDSDRARALATARSRLQNTFRHPAYTRLFLRLGFSEDDLSHGGSDRLVDSLVAHGDEHAVSKRIREHLDAGADHVAVQVMVPDGAEPPIAEWRRLASALSLGATANAPRTPGRT